MNKTVYIAATFVLCVQAAPAQNGGATWSPKSSASQSSSEGSPGKDSLSESAAKSRAESSAGSSARSSVNSLEDSSGQSSAKPSSITAEEVHFTPAQLQTYYRVYQTPPVHYLRKAMDAYLNGKGSEGEAKAFDKWDKSYYRSKFIVMSIDPGLLGGTFLTIMFQNNPDKVFVAWVYNKYKNKADLKGMELRSIELGKFSDQDLKNIKIRYRPFLVDKIHAM
jgi:hypothetical protein